ncbi:unnamed protein product [Urochloa humidicola]
MADKISTIVLKVDLECEKCYKKIRRVLCKIQDKMNIKTISFDEKSNTVTISGPFDPEKVCNKLCSEAGRVIKEMDIKGKEKAKDGGGGGDKPKAGAKGAENKDAGKAEKPKEGKADKAEAKGDKKDDKGGDKKEGKGGDKEAKPEKGGGKDGKAEAKKVKFDLEGAPPADAKPGKAMAGMPPGMTKADLGPLLEKMMAAKAGPEPIAQPPAMAPGAAQGVAVPSIWPAPAGSVSGYGYNPGYEAPPSYYGGGGGGYAGYAGCGCGGYNGYCRCGKPAAPPGGYYGVPVYDSQGWYYGGGGARQPYYGQQQPCCEDPNAGCSVM